MSVIVRFNCQGLVAATASLQNPRSRFFSGCPSRWEPASSGGGWSRAAAIIVTRRQGRQPMGATGPGSSQRMAGAAGRSGAADPRDRPSKLSTPHRGKSVRRRIPGKKVGPRATQPPPRQDVRTTCSDDPAPATRQSKSPESPAPASNVTCAARGSMLVYSTAFSDHRPATRISVHDGSRGMPSHAVFRADLVCRPTVWDAVAGRGHRLWARDGRARRGGRPRQRVTRVASPVLRAPPPNRASIGKPNSSKARKSVIPTPGFCRSTKTAGR